MRVLIVGNAPSVRMESVALGLREIDVDVSCVIVDIASSIPAPIRRTASGIALMEKGIRKIPAPGPLKKVRDLSARALTKGRRLGLHLSQGEVTLPAADIVHVIGAPSLPALTRVPASTRIIYDAPETVTDEETILEKQWRDHIGLALSASYRAEDRMLRHKIGSMQSLVLEPSRGTFAPTGSLLGEPGSEHITESIRSYLPAEHSPIYVTAKHHSPSLTADMLDAIDAGYWLLVPKGSVASDFVEERFLGTTYPPNDHLDAALAAVNLASRRRKPLEQPDFDRLHRTRKFRAAYSGLI